MKRGLETLLGFVLTAPVFLYWLFFVSWRQDNKPEDET